MTLGTTEVSAMRTAAEASMQDTCKLGALSEGTSGWGVDPTRTWAYGSALSCGVGMQRPREVNADGAEVALADVSIRLPHGTDVEGVDRIQVTHRFGVELDSPEFYAILGQPHSGVSAVICNCMRVQGESRA